MGAMNLLDQSNTVVERYNTKYNESEVTQMS